MVSPSFLIHPPRPETLYRLPFYWELRTIFLLYISLPQTEVRPLTIVLSLLFIFPLGLCLCLQNLFGAVAIDKRSRL